MTASKTETPLHELTATEIVAAISAGNTTCEAVARACLAHIAVREPQVLAWQYLDPDQVIAQARTLDQSGEKGPLTGVPFGVKDIINTCDMPTECGSPIYKGYRPREDAACVALGRKAGGVLMGKTVTTEFANRKAGKTRHPLDRTRTPGGSSSGSAAAVADCMVPLAIGTQTAASTIRPAAYCGVYGYRPTYGHLRCAGVKESAGSFDTLGLFARSIEDIALYRDVLLGVTPQAIPVHPPPLRIALCRTHMWPMLERTTQALLEHGAQRLARAGAKVSDVELPADFECVEDAHRWISGFEFARNYTWEIENHRELLSPTLLDNIIRDGFECSYERYVAALEFAERCRQQLAALFEDYDVILTAPATGEAPVGLANTGNASLCKMWTATHMPVVTVPVFGGPHGLPVGAQLIGRKHDDRRLFSAARWVSRCLMHGS